ncbi:MAG: Sec-independent protein translocase subunit TatB [Propionibacteriaceae bacterium]|nr:Sec-independent protein translocase subunit TatB [Propionibacteriaceae bacterium]
MPDFNAAEILVLAVLAVIIFGPEKLPELARKTARVINYVRGIANDARGQLREQLGPEFDDIHLSDLNPRTLGAKLLGEDAARDIAEVGRTATAAASDLSQVVSDSASGTASASGESPQPQPRRVAFDPEAT